MRTNFVQTCKTSANRINLNRIAKRVALIGLFISLGIGNAWAGGSTYYSRAGVKVASGSGTVYVKKGATTASASSYDKTTTGTSFVYTDDASSETENFSTNFAICAVPATDYRFDGWTLSGSWSTNPTATLASTYGVVKGSATSGGSSATTGTAAAKFVQISIASVTPTSKTLSPTDARTTCGDYTGTVTFTTTNDNAAAQIGTPTFGSTTGSGTWTASNSWAAGTSTVTYTFKGNGYYGGSGTSSGSRNNSATLTLPTAGGTSSKSVTFTANFPDLELGEGSTSKVYPVTPTTTVDGTATFPVQYCDGAFDFNATITGASGGTWTPGAITVAITDAATGSGMVTVPFSFNAGGATGDFSATLTLTPVANTGGSAQSVTVTAYAEQVYDYDVEVYNASDVKISDNTTMWADGLTLANSNAGSTIKLMRNIDLGTLTATQSVTNNITLDLNGKTLSGTVSSSIPRLIYMNASGKTLTIKDGKTGGKLSATGSYSNALYCVQINNGNVILNSGTIEIENTNTSQTTADRLYATAVYVNSGKSFTMNGGVVKGTRNARDAYGIYGASSATAQSTITINNGAVYAYGKTYAYGIRSYGIVNIHNGTIHGETTGTSYAYGVFLRASANATASSGYYGKLNMDGGLVEAVSKTTYAYGVFADRHRAGTGAATAVDGTHSNQETGLLNITGGTIKGLPTTTYGYGVIVYGDFSSKDNKHITHIIKNATIEAEGNESVYGVQALAEVNGTYGTCHKADVEFTDCNITANAKTKGTAYAVYGGSAQSTVFENLQPDYFGEYATAAKITINSGTYTADVVTSGAYAICTATRAKSMYNSATSIYANRTLGGEKTGYPELNIHDGTFTATTHTLNGDRHSRAVSSGGNTTINGGTFTATSEGRYARCIYGVAGKLVVNNATIIATANGRYKTDNNASEAAGVFVDAIIQTPTGFTDYCEAEVNNCDITAITKRGTGAYGVYINCTSRPFTALYLRKDSLDNKWTHKDDGSGSYDIYKYIYPSGDRSVAAKCKINGGKIMARTDSLSSAYGVCMAGPTWGHYGGSFAQCELVIKNTDITVTSHTETACGIQTAGPADVDNVSIQATATTTKSYGILCQYPQTTVTNSTFEIKAPNTVYGAYVNASVTSNTSATTSDLPGGKVTIIPKYNYAQIKEGELILNAGNVFVDSAKVGNTAYAVYVHAAKADWTASATYLNATGNYAYAGKATINGGKYTAYAAGTTSYAACVADPVLQGEETATPTLIINDGKFKGTATSTYADVSVAGEPGYFVLNGGYYVKDENLDKKLGEGMNKVAVKSGTPEYTEGYRWRVTDNMTGEYVCKIKENSTSYASLEEALQVVNASPTTTYTIIMIANYTLSKGDYVLPANTTLLIPYYSTQTAINGATPTYTSPAANVEKYEAPTPLYKLTFSNGVNMSVYGKIEASAVTYLSNQGLTTHGTGVVSGKYGWLYLNEGSHIDLESGAALYAWGYVTGKGEINAKNGSAVYEDFQMGDWRGGTAESNFVDNKTGLDKKGVFVITHYYYQNIECPITFRAGAQGMAHGGTYMYKDMGFLGTVDDKVPTKEAVKMIGTSGAMFLMDPATAGEDTWVRKEYDPETDYVNWTMNSGAQLGSVSIHMDLPMLGAFDVNSADYVLPITSNFNIVANYGEIDITNHVCFLPGSKLTIKKEGVVNIPSGQRVFFYDQDDWKSYSGYWFNPYYSPSWKVNPRVATIGDKTKVKMSDAEVLVEGLLNVNGAIYTTAGGANIHSTRENAGKVKFGAALPASTSAIATSIDNKGNTTTLFQITSAPDNKPSFEGKALNSAWLKNEDGSYSKPTSANTDAGDTWTYMQSLTEDTYEWTLASEDGCFTTRKTGDTKTYVHPSDWVAVGAVNANHAYPSEDGTRMFINTEAASTSASCKWWDVNPTPEVIDAVTYYVANNENFDNFGTYYYWDNTTSYWKPKKITVTWRNEDGTKITNGTYGDLYSFNTSPQFHGTNPKKTSTAIEKYDWIGWRDAEGNIYDKNATLPRATSDVTYTAYFNTTKYQYTITFKNDDNSDLWAGLVDAGTTGAELQALFELKYNEKTGTTIPQKAPTVDKVYTFSSWNTSLATVTAAATYTANYTWVTRKYHVTFYSYDAATISYEADVDYNTRPEYAGVTPFRANTSAYSYEWTGWQQGSNTYDTDDELALVTGDVYYVATFAQTELKYQVLFKRQDGSIIDAPFFNFEETPAFPANPTLASTVSTDYTFDHWDPATLTPVTEDGKVYTAYFSGSPRKYTAHFVNYNGTSLNADQKIDYNTVPAYTGATPIKPNDSRNSYEFSGWAWEAGADWEAGSIGVGEAFPAIKGDITFTAQYTPTLLQFDVIYQREDGFVILRDKKKWGESSAFPTTYAGATSGLNYEDATYSYTFGHWSPATVVNPVTTDATYTAYYNQSIKTYSITAVGISPAGYGTVSPASLASIPGGSTVTVNGNTITVNGTTITATPAAADAQYTYTFDHWNNVPATVTGNVTNIEAVFTRTTNTYTVTWKNYDESVLATIELPYDAIPSYGSNPTPTRATDENYGYTFDGWSATNGGDKVEEPLPAIFGNKTYYAHYSTTPTVASVKVGSTTTYYTDFATAWAFVQEQTANTTIKLLQDATVTTSMVFTPAAAMTCTFDLNNHTLSGAVNKLVDVNLAGSTFIITDNSEDKNGKISTELSTNARLYSVFLTAGTLKLQNGKIYSKNPHTYSSASSNKNSAATGVYVTAGQTFTMDGGAIESTSQYSSYALYIAQSTTSVVTINGGLIKGQTNASSTAAGIFNYSTKLTINGGHIIGHAWTKTAYGLYQYGGSATLNGGKIEATNDTTNNKGTTGTYGIQITYVNSTYKGALNIPATSTVEINARSNTSGARAINTTGTGTITVSGGTFNVHTKTATAYGILAARGTVTVNGTPTFNVTAGTTTAYGAYAYGTIGAKGTGKYSGTINIKGGTFNVTSTQETAYGALAGMCELNLVQKGAVAGDTIFGHHYMPGIISVTNGTFNVKAKTTAAYGIVVAAAKSESGAVGTTARRPTATITGGNFKVESKGDDNATAYAMNTSATATYLKVQGGKYSTKRTNASATSNIEDKYTAPTKSCNYHVLPLTGEDPYKYEVAEAYTITFNNYDGTQLQSTAVKKGATPVYSGTTPTKAEDESYTYSFTGWSPAITKVTADATYTATFSSTPKAVTYYYIDPETGEETSVSSASAPADPADYDDEDNHYTFTKWVADGPSYRAQYSSSERTYGAKLDIVDWTADHIVVNATNLRATNGGTAWTIKYASANYTKTNLAADRTVLIARDKAHETTNGYVVIKLQGTAGVESRQKYTVPLIYDENATLSGTESNSVVYVHMGATLTVDANTTISKLYVSPAANVEITSGKLTVTDTLALRTLPWQSAAINGNFTAGHTYYTRIGPDKNKTIAGLNGTTTYVPTRYYQLALPLSCSIAAVRLSDGTTPAYESTWALKNYSESLRASQGSEENNWVFVPESGTIQAWTGYEFISNYKYYREYYFPVTLPASATTVTVARTGDDKANSGWNMICSPLMSRHQKNPHPEDITVSWLNEEDGYTQEIPNIIHPAIPFFYQAKADNEQLSFAGTDVKPSLAPRRVAAAEEQVRIQWMHLDIKDASGQGDQTSVYSHPTRYDAVYKTGIDVAKQSFTASRALIYSSHAYGEMAFAGVADVLLENGVALTVYSPKEQELTISMRDNEWLDRMAFVWLIDNETGAQIDLLDSDYTFEAAAGTTTGRFILMGRFFAPQIATDIDEVDGEQAKPKKLIIRDKLYILINDQLYDGTGKMVK